MPSDERNEDLATEVESVRPYLDLAREIRDAVEAFVSDDGAEVESLVAALDEIPKRQRASAALTVFDQLPPERQWSILERLFGDEELRDHLEAERVARLRSVRRSAGRRGLVDAARSDRRLDLMGIPEGVEIIVGLFRSQDVRAALARGNASQAAARQLVVRSTSSPGEFRVIEDVFNPLRGYFVTAAYDERVWNSERLESLVLVRLGSLVESSGRSELLPIIYPGARMDVELDGSAREGLLHVGFVSIGGEDVFAPDP